MNAHIHFLKKIQHFEKLDPEIYAKLQSTIHEVVEKTVPEYKEWLNSAFGEKIIADDCSNDCPTLIKEVERLSRKLTRL